MKETQEILIKMGFDNPNSNVWESEWFGVFILLPTATPEDIAKFIYNRNINIKQKLLWLSGFQNMKKCGLNTRIKKN